MLIPLLLLVSQPMAQADRLNEALSNCLFATARAARVRAESSRQFETTLDRSCLAEEAAARRAAVVVIMSRGTSRAAADERIDEALRFGRAAVIKAYSAGSREGNW